MSTANETDRLARGAVILCGGGSRRMGRDKASLPFGDETMLARTMRLVAESVPREQVVLVAAAGQQLPLLPWEATVVRDRAADQGPLPAIVDGFAALPASVTATLAVACDSPLLESALVEMLFRSLTPGFDAVIPIDGELLHPLLAVYRPHVAVTLRKQFDAGTHSLHGAIRSAGLASLFIPVEQLRTVDPELRSFLNCNTEEEYRAALERLS